MTDGLEASIERAVADWPAVGLGCGVIAGGATLFARGFGVRRIGGSDAVDDRTLFAIGSVSKSFTGTAIAMLVDEGKVSWDSRVIDHLPGFRLFDQWVTREMTVRDLLTHRSGLERGDFMWYKSGYDSNEVMRRIAHLEPSWSFRTTFGYQNIMYLAAGQLIEAVSGKSWDDFIRERIFTPLEMNDSHPSLATLGQLQNVAQPHALVDGTMTRICPHDGLNVNPAGSIYSNVNDMLAWVRLAIERGAYKGGRLLSTGASQMTQTPQMPIAQSGWSEMFPDVEFLSYAAGWFVCSYRGVTVVTHAGNVDGMSAAAAVVPSENFGMVAFANVNSCRLPQALVFESIDRIIFDRSANRLDEFCARERFGRERLDFAEADRKRSTIPNTRPSRPLETYAGTYEDAFYGSASVTVRDGKLHLRFIGFEGPLDHWQFDSFTVAIDDPYLRAYKSIAVFDLDDFGEPSQLTLVVLGGLRLKLTRKHPEPTPVARPIEELRRYEGRFESTLAALRIAVDLIGDSLKASIPGTLTGSGEDVVVRGLVPVGADRFAITSTRSTLAFDGDTVAVLETPHQMPVELTRRR
jgi:CubicO group peptidase (beta-lactamase class C family)